MKEQLALQNRMYVHIAIAEMLLCFCTEYISPRYDVKAPSIHSCHCTYHLVLSTANQPVAFAKCRISLQEKIAKYRETQQQQQQNLMSQPFQNNQVINMIMQAVMKEHPYMYVFPVLAP